MKKFIKLEKRNISNNWDYLVNNNNSMFSKVFNFFVNFLVLRIINNDLVHIIIKKLKKNKKIIEFGCGRAVTSSIIYKKKPQVKITLVDNNYSIIKYLKKKKKNFQIIQANCLDKNIKKIGKYDISFSSGTFEHFDKYQSKIYLKNMMKISSYGIIAVPAENILWKITSFIRLFTDTKHKLIWSDDFQFYNKNKIKKIFYHLKGYSLIDIRYTYNLGFKTFLIFEFKKK